MVVFTDDYVIWRQASENPSDEAIFQDWPCTATKDIFSDEASCIIRSLDTLSLKNIVIQTSVATKEYIHVINAGKVSFKKHSFI